MIENNIKEIKNNSKKAVAIIGIGFRLPGNSNDSLSLYENLINKFDGVVETTERWSEFFSINNEITTNQAGLISLDEIKNFDPLIFGISPNDVVNIDPSQRLLLKCVYESFEDAHIDPIKLRGSNTSVYIGCSTNEYFSNLINSEETIVNVFGSTHNSAANRINYCFDFRGQSLPVDTQCSSSSNAIALGYQSIVEGRSNYSVVGGMNLILDPDNSKAVSHLDMLGSRCRAFSEDGDGFVRAEGAAVAILKNLDLAIKDGDRIYCLLNSVSANTDGPVDKNSFYSPSKTCQFDNINLAFNACSNDIKPSDIDYVECHGTGTPVGDPIETEAISMVLSKYHSKENPLLIGSFKSNVGHLEAGSGIASLMKICIMYKYRQFLPNIHFNKPNPRIKFDEWNLKVVTEVTPFPSHKKVSMVMNNFGVTGANTCLIFSEFIKQEYSNKYQSINNNNNNNNNKMFKYENDKYYLIPFSANSKKSLENYLIKIINDYDISKNCEFFDFVQYQILSKTTQLYQRSVILAKSWNDIKNIRDENIIKTNDSVTSNLLSTNRQNKDTNICFVFSGQGTQYNEMGQLLYSTNSEFKQFIDIMDSKLFNYFGYSVLEKFNSLKNQDKDTIHNPILAQPMLCMIQVALFEILKKWNITPNFIIGHSLGELPAQYCSGSIDLDTFCHLVYHRANAQQSTVGSGKMLSINISENEFIQQFSKDYPSIEISCYNSPNSIVVSGNEVELKEIELKLKSRNIMAALLSSTSSFHTSSQDKIKNEILNHQFISSESKIPIFSTVYKDLFNYDTIKFDSKYIFQNIREPVYFNQTIQKLYQHIQSNQLGNNLIFIEISPHPALTYHLKQLQPKNNDYFNQITILNSLYKNKNDVNQLFNLISQLYCNHNLQINFENQLSPLLPIDNIDTVKSYKFKNHLNLPKYQWDDKEYFKEDSLRSKHRIEGPPVDLKGNRISTSPFITFKTIINIDKPMFQFLKGHQVRGKYYLPGCAYLENIINSFPDNDLVIGSLEFKSPVIFIEGVNKQIQTNIYQTSKNNYRAQFHYYESASSKWIQTSTSNFQLFQINNSNEKKLDIDRLKSICNSTIVNSNEFYENTKMKTGLGYYGDFRNIKQIHMGKECALYNIPFKKINESVNVGSIISCAILDSCFNGGISLIEETCPLVFDKIENLCFYSSNLPRNYKGDLYVFTRFKGRKGDTFNFSTVVMIENGSIIIEVENDSMISTTPILNDSLSVEYPTNQISVTYLQEKHSKIITNLNLFNNQEYIFDYPEYKILEIKHFIASILLYYLNIKLPEITIEEIREFDKFKENNLNNSNHTKLFDFVFQHIIEYYQVDQGTFEKNSKTRWNENTIEFYRIFIKSTKIMIDILFPIGENIENPQSIFENNLIDGFYTNDYYKLIQKLLSEIIKESLEPLVKKKHLIRIIEFGGGTASLSIDILNSINQLLDETNGDYEIDIEYTFSDISSTFLSIAKEKLSFFKHGKILFKILNLDDSLIDKQKLNRNYYDFVVMSNVLHVVKNISFGLNEIHQILKINGYLIFTESSYKSIFSDSIFGIFEQWWSFNDNIRIDRCSLKKDQWEKILKLNNFKNIKISNDNGISSLLIHSQKQEILNENNNFNERIIFYCNSIVTENCKLFINNFKNNQNQLIINSIDQLNEIITKTTTTTITTTTIYFLKTIDQLNLNNFKEITLEYIKIVQFLIKNKLQFKFVLISLDNYSKETINYLASSVHGAFRYYLDEYEDQLLYFFDIDSESLLNSIRNLSNLISQYTNPKYNQEREYFIRNNEILVERIKYYSNISKKYKSDSTISPKEINSFYSKLNSNLEFQLDSKPPLLDNCVEVKVNAIGLNYKDYLIYTRNVQNDIINHNGEIHSPEFGNDFSGTIISIGKNVNKFKVGDQVYALNFNTSSTHMVISEDDLTHKPVNLTHSQAASIPLVYLTSYYSLFVIGNLRIDDNQTSILIHSATGGIGLSAIELLKWKGFKSHLFVTVGSKEKEEFLKNKYGSFITGIYSSRNKDYVKEIKLKLLQLGYSKKQGVDLILNTLSSDFIESNFRCLNPGGRIIDLSINHLNSNDFIDYGKFKYNYGYHNIELLYLDKTYLNNLLKIISEALSRGTLSLIPITEFSINNIKESFEFINQRKHIGKIIINYDKDITSDLLLMNCENQILKSNYSISSDFGKTILITGQSGIALEFLKWISKYSLSVENIIILSKSKLKWELELLINNTNLNNKRKLNFYFKSCDIEFYQEIDSSLNEIFKENKEIQDCNIDSILHFAFVNDVVGPLEIDMNNLNIAHGAKTIGAINLHNLSINYKWNVKNFIMASSISSIYGSLNQCTYLCSNNCLNSLAKYRKSLGLSAISINWGRIGNTGIVARDNTLGELLDSLGFDEIKPNLLFGTLDLLTQNQSNLQNDYDDIIVTKINFEILKLKFSHLTSYKNDFILNSLNQNYNNNNNNNNNSTNNISSNSIAQKVISKLAELLNIEETNINKNIILSEYGVDSLLVIQFKNWIDQEIKKNLFNVSELQNFSINLIIKKISTIFNIQ